MRLRVPKVVVASKTVKSGVSGQREIRETQGVKRETVREIEKEKCDATRVIVDESKIKA